MRHAIIHRAGPGTGNGRSTSGPPSQLASAASAYQNAAAERTRPYDTERLTQAVQRNPNVRLRLMCEAVASLDARHRNTPGAERRRAQIAGLTVIWPCLRPRS